MKARLGRELIAMRAAREFHDGAVVNLGIGIPTLCSNFVPPGMRVMFHTENGCLGYGRVLTEEEMERADVDLINAGGQFVAPQPGMCFVHHADSFVMVRGGHIDITVLGAFQVSEKGDLANWFLPERGVGNIGGAMDLAFCSKRVIALMEHTTQKGQPRLLKECSYPLTAPRCVDLIISDIAVIKVTPEGLVLRELVPGWTPQEVQALTEPHLLLAPDLQEIQL